ncbi:hypothetical protein MPSEU_000784300 [Mayamaea pseudoterrestris]|nr:hypothetical protein MPSEU_000784300 [Mayamaea pseudoterrestris]
MAALAQSNRTLRISAVTLRRSSSVIERINGFHIRFSSSAGSRVERLGDHPYGSRQYRLVNRQAETVLASIHAHRNIIFGARVHQEGYSMSKACQTLLIEAVLDAGSNGEQPQSMAALHGLCEWVVQQGLEPSNSASSTIQSITDNIQLEAVKAIATNTPRPGHSVVGQGTHRDAGDAWEHLAREFVQSKAATDSDDECVLHQRNGGQLVEIELLADTKPEYLQSAGGAMARFFLL